MTFKNTLLLSFGFLLSASSYKAQTISKEVNKHTAFIELLGPTGYYSVNYDRILFIFQNKSQISIRVGFSALYLDTAKYNDPPSRAYAFFFPLMLNWIIGKKNHHFEIGAGGPIADHYDYIDFPPTTQQRQVYWVPELCIGYRYQKPEGGLMLRVTCYSDHFLKGLNGFLLTPYPGISVGYSF